MRVTALARALVSCYAPTSTVTVVPQHRNKLSLMRVAVSLCCVRDMHAINLQAIPAGTCLVPSSTASALSLLVPLCIAFTRSVATYVHAQADERRANDDSIYIRVRKYVCVIR